MTKKAFIVGINAYPQYPLSGCVNDANDWNTTLANLGFTNSILLDSMATKANMIAGLNWLFENSVSGDVLVFCYSGHGSKVVDTSGDEVNGYDEVLCSVDFFSGNYITDDELRVLFASKIKPGVTLEVFLDSCYSGTATRALIGTDLKARCIPGPVTNGKKTKRLTLFERLTTIVPSLNHILWAGCKENQTSAEVTINGIPRGLFTYYMANYIRQFPTYLRSALATKVQNSVKAVNINQYPQLECTSTENNQKPFT